MKLFHVCRALHAPGAVIGGYPLSHFIESRMLDPEYAELETALEESRPAASNARRSAVFAFDSLEACSNFWGGERRSGTRSQDYDAAPHHYLVAMSSPTRAPIALVGHAFKRLQCRLPYAEILAEYWSPTREWHAWEYLAPTARVVAEVDAPADSIAASAFICSLMADLDLRRRLWPI